MLKKMWGVYRSRMLVLNPNNHKDAIFKSKREADLLAQSLNAHNAGFYVAQIITGKRIVKI